MDGQNFTDEERECLATANDLRRRQGQPNASELVASNNEHLPIFQLDYATLIENFPNIGVLTNNNPNEPKSMAHRASSARRDNHEDRDGNLPDAFPAFNYEDDNNEEGYFEYHVDHSGVSCPKNLRVVYDTRNARLYVSPSHYNAWKDNDGTPMNPFFLVANHPPLVCGGKANWT